jgi:hypothetical protein
MHSGMLGMAKLNDFDRQANVGCSGAHFCSVSFFPMSGRRVQTVARFRADAVW